MSSVIAGRCRVGINVDLLIQVLNFKFATTVVGRRRLLQRITWLAPLDRFKSLNEGLGVGEFLLHCGCMLSGLGNSMFQRYYRVRILFE